MKSVTTKSFRIRQASNPKKYVVLNKGFHKVYLGEWYSTPEVQTLFCARELLDLPLWVALGLLCGCLIKEEN